MSTATDRVAVVHQLAERLAELVTLENQLLADRRPREIADLQDEKLRLSESFQAEMDAVRRDPAILAGADPQAVADLKATIGRFNQVLDEHRRRLVSAKTVTERLVAAISEEVARKDRPAPGYDSSAGPARDSRALRRGRPVSLALNQVV